MGCIAEDRHLSFTPGLELQHLKSIPAAGLAKTCDQAGKVWEGFAPKCRDNRKLIGAHIVLSAAQCNIKIGRAGGRIKDPPRA
ncbi:hypothetical protein D3C76_1643800 [compost metagenome]